MFTRMQDAKKERVLEGLQLPKQKAKEASTKAKEIVLEAILTNDQMKAKEGSYMDEKAIKTLIRRRGCLWKGPGYRGEETLSQIS